MTITIAYRDAGGSEPIAARANPTPAASFTAEKAQPDAASVFLHPGMQTTSHEEPSIQAAAASSHRQNSYTVTFGGADASSSISMYGCTISTCFAVRRSNAPYKNWSTASTSALDMPSGNVPHFATSERVRINDPLQEIEKQHVGNRVCCTQEASSITYSLQFVHAASRPKLLSQAIVHEFFSQSVVVL